MSHRDTFLNRIRAKLPYARLPEAEPEHPGSFQGYSSVNVPLNELVERFQQELTALAGQVYIIEDGAEIPAIILSILQRHKTQQLLSWGSAALEVDGLGEALLAAEIELVAGSISVNAAERQSQLAALAKIQVGLTGTHGALADTGAIALISGPEQGRLVSLLPPVHIAILPRHKIYPSLPAFLVAQPEAVTIGSNLVFIAGPSRTGDIEMTLTMGVHGPGEVHVIITP